MLFSGSTPEQWQFYCFVIPMTNGPSEQSNSWSIESTGVLDSWSSRNILIVIELEASAKGFCCAPRLAQLNLLHFGADLLACTTHSLLGARCWSFSVARMSRGIRLLLDPKILSDFVRSRRKTLSSYLLLRKEIKTAFLYIPLSKKRSTTACNERFTRLKRTSNSLNAALFMTRLLPVY